MNILAVDTSSELGSAVIRVGDRIVAQIRPDTSLQYSEHLFASIDQLFDQVDLKLDDIDSFAAVRGPGSFTGLRVGLATMEGFAFTMGKPTYGISTLAALAWQVDSGGQPGTQIVPILDARRGEIYSAVYVRDGEELVEVSPPAVLQPAQWFESLGQGPTVFCGDGTSGHRVAIEAQAKWNITDVSPYLATVVAMMADTDSREVLEPLYVRRTTAEINRLANQSGQDTK
jgi:tRNA threonylcarbamoyladenosine biosynthesis protein TsaB